MTILKHGQRFGPFSTRPFQSETLRQYAIISQDLNPIHLSKKAAQQAGFSSEIVHGMLIMGMAHSHLASVIRGAVVQSFQSTFVLPTFVDEALFFAYYVEKINDVIVTLNVEAQNENREVVLRGQIVVHLSFDEKGEELC